MKKKLNPKLNKKYCQDYRLDLRSNCLKTVTVILNVTSSRVIARPRGNHLKKQLFVGWNMMNESIKQKMLGYLNIIAIKLNEVFKDDEFF